MWNQIRGPPLVHRNQQTGQIGFFAGGHGYQFIAETYIVFSIYGLIVLGVILMNEAPKYPNDSAMKKSMYCLFENCLNIYKSGKSVILITTSWYC